MDEATLEVQGGDGGDGASTFQRERNQSRGGPDGGDGGRGGDVLFVADPSLNTLFHFRGEKFLRAEDGAPAGRNRRRGADGGKLTLKVPVGTILYDEDAGRLIADLAEAGESVVVGQGGRGGRGNARFATPSKQSPRLREHGEPGESVRVRLEMRILADVGLVGLPNAGKSTLLSRISHARPKVADYPFTTLAPVLGVVETEREGFVVAELPGLVEGASQGAGLGHSFLRHVGRAKILVYVLDGSSEDPRRDFLIVRGEAMAYSPKLERLEQIVALNKIDLVAGESRLREAVSSLAAEAIKVVPISALTGQNVGELVGCLDGLVRESVRARGKGPPPSGRPAVYRKPASPLQVEACPSKSGGRDGQPAFRVRGTMAQRWAAMADLDSPEGVAYLHRGLSAAGVIRRLEELGAKDGDTVVIGEVEFTFVPGGHLRGRDLPAPRPARRRVGLRAGS